MSELELKTNNNPLVSVIIPLYNAEKYIGETIQNILNQTYYPIEIIIIDDGSTDNSLTIARTFEYKNVKIYSQPNSGASAARNFGLREAKGDFIQFLDADDLIGLNKIQFQIQGLIDKPNFISFCSTKHFMDGENCILEKHSNDLNSQVFDNPTNFLINLYGGFDSDAAMITVHSWLTPKHIINQAGLWNEYLTVDDDGEFFCRVILKSSGVIFTGSVINYYRKYTNRSSLSNLKSAKSIESMILSAISKKEHLLSVSSSKHAKKALSNQFLEIAVASYPMFMRLSKKAERESLALGGSKKKYYTHTSFYRIISKLFGWKVSAIISFLKVKFKTSFYKG